MKVMFTIAER